VTVELNFSDCDYWITRFARVMTASQIAP